MATNTARRGAMYPRGFARTLGGFLPVRSLLMAWAISLLSGFVVVILVAGTHESGTPAGRVTVAAAMAAVGFAVCRRLISLNRARAELRGIDRGLGWILIVGTLSMTSLGFTATHPLLGWVGLGGVALSFGWVLAGAISAVEDRRARRV